MTRVALVSIRGTSRAGGVERVVERQREALEGRSGRYDVRVIALPDAGFIGALRRRVPLAERALLAAFPLLSGVGARAWAGRRGVVVSHGFSAIGLGCDAVFAHGCWAAYARAARIPRGAFGLLAHAYERLAAHLAGRVVSVSEPVVEQWVRHYGLDRARSAVLPNAVDTAAFAPGAPDAAVCEAARLRVLFVGRLEPAKGLDVLERLHAEVAAGLDVSVCLCSPGAPAPGLAARFPRFELRSGLDAAAMRAEYARADLFLLPSRYEAFELSSLEALACGTPVLLNPTGARPTLERLGCPALYALERAASPGAAIREAAAAFRGLRRGTIAAWTARHFDGRVAAAAFLRLVDELERSR